jgi:hypothetical protein
MHSLSGQELLRIWEVGQHQHSVSQALTILAVAEPEVSQDELLALSIGQRDARLLAVRVATFGSQLVGYAECTDCQERLEFTLDVADIRVVPESQRDSASTSRVYEATIEDYKLRFRLPNSLDLAYIVRCRDELIARTLLLQRCVLHTSLEGQEVEQTNLPETILITLADLMEKYDPQADIQLNLSCPICGQNLPMTFDIVSFLWAEICVQAKRLLREVHTLARAYGWREMDILAMSPTRRQFYLEMVI